jgi:hypothetical protein
MVGAVRDAKMAYEEDRIVWLQRKVQRMADKYGASVQALRANDAVLIALLDGRDADAEEDVMYQYGYCEDHDDDHGVCRRS